MYAREWRAKMHPRNGSQIFCQGILIDNQIDVYEVDVVSYT